MSLLSSSISVRSLADEEADRNMLQDLQLAAELGKTLLDRNKELETSLKTYQATIDEQAQEIEYMKKQTAALREVNDSRLKVYEQLEVSIQDLERANHRLVVENTADKKLIKSQCLTIENLEAKCEELQKKIDELKNQYDNLMRQQQSSTQKNDNTELSTIWKGTTTQDGSIHQIAARSPSKSSPVPLTDGIIRVTNTSNSDEEVTELLRQLQETRNQRAREQKRVNELREQLETLLKENTSLEEQLNEWKNKAQDMKENLQEELNTLEVVRQGKVCGRCLRSCETRTHDELSIMLDHEEDDDLSIAESYLNDSHHESDTPVQEPAITNGLSPEVDANPYRVLVEKYEALLEVQLQPARRKPSIPTPCMSLQEELEMSGDFNSFTNSQSQQDNQNDITKQNGSYNRNRNGKKPFSATPTDFSEAETSSSGFSDETSNKSTQTDGRPGSLLCSIDDDDCRFSIYDDTSSLDSRFNKAPEYRQLFGEIFGVLKRAAEAKDEGAKLPLIENTSINQSTDNSKQDDSLENDDTMSIMSSVISSVVSEPVIRIQTPTPEKNQDKLTRSGDGKCDNITRHPHKRHQQYDYLSVQVRKKNTAKKHAQRKLNYSDRSTTPDIVPTQNPKFLQVKSNSGGKRQKFRPLTQAEQDGTFWNGNTIHVFSSKTRESHHRKQNGTTRNEQQQQHNTILHYNKEYKASSASEEVARLRRLEMSYAEALRMPNKPKANNSRRH